MQKTWGLSLGRESPLKKEMATYASIFSWRIPWTEEPGGLQSMGSQSPAGLNEASMGRNYKEEDFILMKDLVASRAVQNRGECLCERVIFSLPRGLAG